MSAEVVCHATGKTVHATTRDACGAARAGGTDGRNVYRCPWCGGYHWSRKQQLSRGQRDSVRRVYRMRPAE